jgi:hypothetical protein
MFLEHHIQHLNKRVGNYFLHKNRLDKG